MWSQASLLPRLVASSVKIAETAGNLIKDFVIWVDPLDGTSEFAAAMYDKSISLDQVTVLIGIAYQGKPISGIIHQPYYNNGVGRTLWGVLGIGSFNYENKVCLSQKIAVTTKSHSTALVDLTLKSLKEKKLIEKVERVGGAGFKVINILEGATAYVFASDGCRKWDTCAPEAVLSAAGGQLTNLSGQSYSYKIDAEHQNHGGVLATGFGTNHQSFIDAIPAQVKETLCKL
uniref:3'(2'),5'-bisphosphate nucleotidase 1 n=1 Tax=Rhabditophanes sp. KR3021 TaxID=114890 RepID=A0AC35UHA1_9BILA